MPLLPPEIALELVRLLRELSDEERKQVKAEFLALLQRAALKSVRIDPIDKTP
jgi:hypothetical protein